MLEMHFLDMNMETIPESLFAIQTSKLNKLDIIDITYSGPMVQMYPLKYQILDRVQHILQSRRQDRRCHIKINHFI